MPQNTLLLLKVAKEINIGKDTIVEFLVSRGYNVENKGTTKLTTEMVDLVYNQFQKEIQNAEKQRQKFQEVKKIQTTISNSILSSSTKETEARVSAIESDDYKPEDTSDFDAEIYVKNVIPDVILVEPEKDANDTSFAQNSALEEVAPAIEPVVETPLPPATEPAGTVEMLEEHESKVAVMSIQDVETAKMPQVDSVIKLEKQNKKQNRAKTEIATEHKKQRNEAKQALKEKEDKISVKTSKTKNKTSKEDTKSNNKTATDKAELSAEEQKKRRKKKPKKTEEIVEQTPVKPVVRIIPEKPRAKKTTEIEVINNKVELPSYSGLTILGKIDINKAKEQEAERASNSNQQQSGNRVLRSRKKDKFQEQRHNDENRKPFDRNRNHKDFRDNRENRDNNRDNRDNRYNKDNKDFKYRDKNNTSPGGASPTFRDNRNRDTKPADYQSRFVDRKEAPRFDSEKIGDSQRYSTPYAPGRSPERKSFAYNSASKGERSPDKVGGYDDKKKKRKTLQPTYSEADIKKVMRATLVEMDDTSSGSKKAKIKMKKKAEREEKEATRQAIIEQESKILKLTEFVTTSDLAALLNVKATDIMTMCFSLGLMVTINQRLDKETITLIVADYGLEAEFVEEAAEDIIADIVDNEEDLVTRSPIITVMGHVDHGKTSLLDYIKNSNVVAGEAGGITQHIGAYHVVLKSKKSITFLDTPGHEAFTAMRARGAQVTDIVVIVVAADDSVMPQTIEAISHARAANVPIIVAINKIDKAEANVDKIKQQLSEQGILVEDWGGKYQCVEISAKKGTNIDILLDKILLEAEMLELRANPKRKAQGIIIEANEKKGLGFVATVVIQNGTLFLRDNFVAGANYGKVRALLDERFRKVEDVLPSQPATVVGFAAMPEAGDTFIVLDTEAEAREIAEKRAQLRREQKMRKVRLTTLDDISAQISIGGVKDLNLIIKGDMAGSVEALSDSLLKLSTDEVRINIVLKSAGNISESDVMLAAASNAIMIGFNVSSTPQSAKLAEQEDVEIRRYNIIYDCINEIHLALEGMLRPDIKEEIAATIEVRQIFKISRIGQIAGCYVSSGKVTRNDKVRIIRDGFPIFNGTITSLKRNKDDAKEVDTGYECGIQVGNFNTFIEGDIIEALRYVEIKRTLDIK